MPKNLQKLEKFGLLFVIGLAALLTTLRYVTKSSVVGIFFGSVNDSIWEHCKLLLLAYIIWGMIELLSLKPSFKRFMVSKILSLYILGIIYILFCLMISPIFNYNYYFPEFLVGVISSVLAFWASMFLYSSDFDLAKLFMPCFFLFLLFVALYCTLTPFPMQCYIFIDRSTGMYGIIPENIDMGDIALDTMYNLN